MAVHVRPPGARAIPVGDAVAAAWLNAWELALETLDGSGVSVAADDDRAAPARRRGRRAHGASVGGTLGGPIGAADIALTAEQSRLSDGNRARDVASATLRYPLAPAVFVVYAANRVTFAERSLRYWDPLDYIAHSAGLEVASRELRGLSWAVRALPGNGVEPRVAAANDRRRPSRRADRPRSSIDRRFNSSTSGELTWREPAGRERRRRATASDESASTGGLGVTLGVRILP